MYLYYTHTHMLFFYVYKIRLLHYLKTSSTAAPTRAIDISMAPLPVFTNVLESTHTKSIPLTQLECDAMSISCCVGTGSAM